jgi:hypothetical protein
LLAIGRQFKENIMAIVDLDKTKEAVDLYENLKQALLYAQEWSDRVVSLTAQLSNNPVYLQNASPEEMQFINSATTVSNVYTKAVPVAPDAEVSIDITPVSPPIPVEPLPLV